MSYKLASIILIATILVLSGFMIFHPEQSPQYNFPKLAFMPVQCGNNGGSKWMMRDGYMTSEIGISGTNSLSIWSGQWRTS